ncbi:hypothetical protein CDD81_4476 [Ophiocordyceps australis]|uniref:Uncharacterized protein n=1 Tax=Ophiocordyceps australis TaxID=1399860 RepID=A0A2C5YJJ1_9HYPO|nr:hypothetical protein CDD81_4476 [Ophiocordyceps australis]
MGHPQDARYGSSEAHGASGRLAETACLAAYLPLLHHSRSNPLLAAGDVNSLIRPITGLVSPPVRSPFYLLVLNSHLDFKRPASPVLFLPFPLSCKSYASGCFSGHSHSFFQVFLIITLFNIIILPNLFLGRRYTPCQAPNQSFVSDLEEEKIPGET